MGISRREFKDILKKGRVAHAPHMSLRSVKAAEGKKSAFTFVVSRKVSQKSVTRNLLKRRGRHSVREQQLLLPLRGIVFFKKGADSLSFEELRDEITSLLEQVGARGVGAVE